VSDQNGLAGQLLSNAMSEVEWLEYETLILEVSDFGDTSEIDGLLCMGWLAGEELASAAFIGRYFHPAENTEALPRVSDFLRRHAAWVEQRCARPPAELSDAVPQLRFDFDPDAEQWHISFDAQLWLLGWRRGVADFATPELGIDSRLMRAYVLICMAAEQTDEVFADGGLDEEFEVPDGVDQKEYVEQLLDLASPQELAISEGVSMAMDLVPRVLPALREPDAVALDDQLAHLDADIERAWEQLNAEAEAEALDAGEGLYGARMDWVSGRDERLSEAFFAAADGGRLAQERLEQIETLWNTQIVAADGLPFEYVDGFLSAHRVTPNSDSFDLQHIMFPLFAEQAEGLDDDVVVELVRGLQDFHAHIGARGEVGESEQLQGVPAQVNRHLETDEAEAANLLGARWSEGFRAGLSYFCPVFGTYLQQDQMLFALILPMIQLSFQPEGLEHEFTLAERRELVAGIPETLVEIAKRMERQAHTPVRQADKVGRNDPCPCASGKKYKKCCGAS